MWLKRTNFRFIHPKWLFALCATQHKHKSEMVATGVATAHAYVQLEKHSYMMIKGGLGSKWMELKWVRRRRISRNNSQVLEEEEKPLRRPLLPVYISTDPRHVDPQHLRDLCATCNHSCHRFPNLLPEPEPEPVDIHKLRIALSHSAVLVSVFCKPHHVLSDDAFANKSSSSSSIMAVTDFFTPVSPSRDQLVGFGRAVSDFGLTASIYDVMVTLIANIFKMKKQSLIVISVSQVP